MPPVDRRATGVSPSAAAALLELRTATAVRSRCDAMLAAALNAGVTTGIDHFTVRPESMPDVVHRVLEELGPLRPDQPPSLGSRWRDFEVGGRDRWRELASTLVGASADEIAKARFDLALVSALLDADAGDAWTYHEAETGTALGRNEAVAVASFRAFQKGLFSSRAGDPLRVDAAGLSKITAEGLEAAFPGAAEHPLHALAARAALLRNVGAALLHSPHLFGAGEAVRFGGLFDVLARRAARGALSARDVLAAVLEALDPALAASVASPTTVDGAPLGDVWRHPAAGGAGTSEGLVPLHRAAQLVAYSLIEPLEEAGHTVADVGDLTALSDAWAGGLLVDGELLVPKIEGTVAVVHAASSEVVVEWRALTVSLLDRVAEAVRKELGVSAEALPVGHLLPAIRAAGIGAAHDRRGAGVPPIRVDGDGVLV